jgi:hypothetical protein
MISKKFNILINFPLKIDGLCCFFVVVKSHNQEHPFHFYYVIKLGIYFPLFFYFQIFKNDDFFFAYIFLIRNVARFTTNCTHSHLSYVRQLC